MNWHWFLSVFMSLVGLHFIADFALQNDYVANFKNRHTNYNKDWIWVLGAHAIIHGFMVFYVTQSLVLYALETAIHAWTDDRKCAGKLTYTGDQSIHLFCKFLWAVALVKGFV